MPITVDVKPKLTADYKIRYEITSEGGARETLDGQDVLHIRDLSMDGVSGISRMKMAMDAINVASQAQRAASRVFESGVMAGGALEFPNALSDKSYQRMRDSLANDYSGAENAGKWLLIEEGGKASQFSATPADAQQIENRNHQIEEIARIFGVPRPLLMLDDTSWGSGIEQLAIFFVQYTLAPGSARGKRRWPACCWSIPRWIGWCSSSTSAHCCGARSRINPNSSFAP